MSGFRAAPPPPGHMPVGLGGVVNEGVGGPEDDYADFDAWGDEEFDDIGADDHVGYPPHSHEAAPPPVPSGGMRRTVPLPPTDNIPRNDPPRPPMPSSRAPPPVPGGNRAGFGAPSRPVPNRTVPQPPPHAAADDGEEVYEKFDEEEDPAQPMPVGHGGRPPPQLPPNRAVPSVPAYPPPPRQNGLGSEDGDDYTEPTTDPHVSHPPALPSRGNRPPPPQPIHQDPEPEEDYLCPDDQPTGPPAPPPNRNMGPPGRGPPPLPSPSHRPPVGPPPMDDQEMYEEPDFTPAINEPRAGPGRPPISAPPTGRAPPPSRVPHPTDEQQELYEDIPPEETPTSPPAPRNTPSTRGIPQPPVNEGRSLPQPPSIAVLPPPPRSGVPQPPDPADLVMHSSSGPATRRSSQDRNNNNQMLDKSNSPRSSTEGGPGPKRFNTVALRTQKDGLRSVHNIEETMATQKNKKDTATAEPDVDFSSLSMKDRIKMMATGGMPTGKPAASSAPPKNLPPPRVPPSNQPKFPVPNTIPTSRVPPVVNNSVPRGKAEDDFRNRNLPAQPVRAPPQTQPDVSGYRWYHGKVERSEVEPLLCREGMFVVRDSSSGGKDAPYVLCVLYKQKVYNLKIRMRSDVRKFALGTYHDREETFSSVAGLVQFHKSNFITLAAGGQVKLTDSPECDEDIYDETIMG